MSASMIKVLVVDDHPVAQAGLALFLQTIPDLVLVGTASTGEEARALSEQTQPDVVLMDMKLPDMDGLTALQQIKEFNPDIKVIALSTFSGGELVERAVQAGASGYLLKTTTAQELADAIHAAYHGRTVLAPTAVEALMQTLRQHSVPKAELTHREQEVLALLKQGLSNAQIANQLMVSPATVKFHMRGILMKLKVSSRAEAVTIAWQHDRMS